MEQETQSQAPINTSYSESEKILPSMSDLFSTPEPAYPSDSEVATAHEWMDGLEESIDMLIDEGKIILRSIVDLHGYVDLIDRDLVTERFLKAQIDLNRIFLEAVIKGHYDSDLEEMKKVAAAIVCLFTDRDNKCTEESDEENL